VGAFLDTNILIYAQQAGAKGEAARRLLAEGGTISVQVLNEFASVATRKHGRSWQEVAQAVEDILALVEPPVPLTLALHQAARALAAADRVNFYDALIVCAAQQAGCERLYSEDLQAGRRFGRLRVVNPFSA
jgi:predicted nucleic acid-binding protein